MTVPRRSFVPRPIRFAGPDDAAGCLEIYGPIVVESPASFEIVVPDRDEMARRIAATTAIHPWLVWVADDGRVDGYAYAGVHRAREAYQWSTEVSVYVRPQAHRRGIATALYGALLACLRRQGYVNAYAGITLPNPASVAFHESMGFRPVGVYRGIGYKSGRWHDVGWWSLRLAEPAGTPSPPTPFPACRDELAALLAGGR